MKKLTYLLFVMFSLVIITSCSKDETVDPVTEQTSGEKYPEYVGYWQNDSTTVDGVESIGGFNWEFDIQDVKAIRYSKNDPSNIYICDSWKIENNQLILYRDGFGYTNYTIVTPPTNNKMVLKVIPTRTNEIDLFYLSKR